MHVKETVGEIIENAIAAHASDIFFLIRMEKVVVNLRTIDGLQKQAEFAVNEGKEIINYLKFAAQMDITEHRRPQVGALEYLVDQQSYYLRLSSLGDFIDCESLVIRIIYQLSSSNYFFEQQLRQLNQLAGKRGLILTSGPTGSGKTTTMYQLAKEVGKGRMVMTIEDPVEIHEKTFLQTQVNLEAGIADQTLLEAALRHRPDILIIGEIRNASTARLAVNAALSGHLVFATVHARSTLQTISRLESLQVSPVELENCLTAVCYQRLLPVEKEFSCLMDIAAGDNLRQAISRPQRGDYINWAEHLSQLKEGGRISAQVYEQFQAG